MMKVNLSHEVQEHVRSGMAERYLNESKFKVKKRAAGLLEMEFDTSS